MKEGDRIRIRRPISREYGEEGTILKIDRNYVPECIVLLDKYAEKIPEIGIRFFYTEDLEKI